jgi:hypothetical protein
MREEQLQEKDKFNISESIDSIELCVVTEELREDIDGDESPIDEDTSSFS